MAQGLINTKRRIQSITSTKKITKAMELVATVKLKKWKDSMEHIVLYLESMDEIIATCASGVASNDILELKDFKDATNNLYIVVTSSLGLCGGYNYNIFKFLNGIINKNDKVIVIGTKGFSKLGHEGYDLDDEFVNVLDKIDFGKVKEVVSFILNEYKKGIYKKVVLISTEYKNSLTFIPKEYQLLPLNKNNDVNKDIVNKDIVNKEIVFEPSKEVVLGQIIPKYLNTFVFGRFVEASVCEQAARRNAMDSATDNAEELLEKLRIEYNKARQGAITQEITEVVAGASNA